MYTYISIIISLSAMALSMATMVTNKKTSKAQEEYKLLLRQTMYDVAGIEEDIAGILSREGE